MADKALTALAAEFGIVQVAPENVPAPPRPRVTDTVRWDLLKEYLPTISGHWVMAKHFDNAGASVTASTIRAGKSKIFSAAEYDARSESVKDADNKVVGSKLYLIHRANGHVSVPDSE